MKIEFVIDNKSEHERNAVLLGSNYNMFNKNYGSDEGIEITCLINDFDKVDYLKMLHQVMNMPSWIQSIMYESFYIKNKELIVNCIHRDANGYTQCLPVKLQRNKWKDVPIVFDANASIELKVPANSKIMFIVDDGKSQYSKTNSTNKNKRKLLLT